MTDFPGFERAHVRPKPGRTLIVGSHLYREKEDRRLRYRDVIGVDMQAGPGVDRVLDMEEPLPDDLGTFEHVECMSVLEHSKRPWLLAANVERLMNPGATLYVTVPFVFRIHGYPDDYWRLTPRAVALIFPSIVWRAQRLVNWQVEEEGRIKLRVEKIAGTPWFPRTETMCFGRKDYGSEIPYIEDEPRP